MPQCRAMCCTDAIEWQRGGGGGGGGVRGPGAELYWRWGWTSET